MDNQLLLDTEQAITLSQLERAGAEIIDAQRFPLQLLLSQSAAVAQIEYPPIPTRLLGISDYLHEASEALARRVWTVMVGGEDINGGLWALGVIADSLEVIETRDGSSEADGYASKDDLEWAAEHLEGTAGLAALWLIEHREFLAALSRAGHDSGYLKDPYRSEFVDGEPGWGPQGLTASDIAAFETQLETWAVLLPVMSDIDTAAKGGGIDGTLSKEDFEAILGRVDLPDEVREAAKRVLADEAFHNTGFTVIDFLDLLTFLPVVGDFVDFGLAMYYFSEGDYAMAIAHGIGVIPVPGLAGGIGVTLKEGLEQFTKQSAKGATTFASREYVKEAGQAFARQEIGEFAGNRVSDITGNEHAGSLITTGVTGDFSGRGEFTVAAVAGFVEVSADHGRNQDLEEQLDVLEDRLDDLGD